LALEIGSQRRITAPAREMRMEPSRERAASQTTPGESTVTRYLTLITFTDQGIRAIEKTLTRAANFCSIVEASGGRVVSQYWAVGEVDGCIVFEAPDETTAAALLLSLGKQGHVRTRSLRIYNDREFQEVLSKS
jgi:uncharacterized protein with GYD domain